MGKKLLMTLTVMAVSLGLIWAGGCESDAGTGATIGGLGGAGWQYPAARCSRGRST